YPERDSVSAVRTASRPPGTTSMEITSSAWPTATSIVHVQSCGRSPSTSRRRDLLSNCMASTAPSLARCQLSKVIMLASLLLGIAHGVLHHVGAGDGKELHPVSRIKGDCRIALIMLLAGRLLAVENEADPVGVDRADGGKIGCHA